MAAGNTMNDVADVDIDRKNKSHKPIPSGRISVESASKVAYLFGIISLGLMAFGCYLSEEPIAIVMI